MAASRAVFLHGWPMDHRDEAATYDAAFAKAGYGRLYVDLPGMGRSADEPVPHDLDGYVDAIVRLIGDEIGDAPFVLGGTSAGALLARGLAARLRPQISGLMLRVPLIVADDAHRDRQTGIVLRSNAALVGALGRNEREVLDATPVLVQTRDWIDALMEKLAATVIPAGKAANEEALEPIRHDPARYALRAVLPVFDGPALVIAGRQDEVVGWRDQMAALAEWPRATVAILDMAGHEFPLGPQKPLLDALVADFLSRIAQAPVE